MSGAKIRTTDDGFHDLWTSVHKARSNTKTISVSKESLMALLMDHANMIDHVKPTSVEAASVRNTIRSTK